MRFFYLCGYIKGRVYKDSQINIGQLQEAIAREINGIPLDKIKNVLQSYKLNTYNLTLQA